MLPRADFETMLQGALAALASLLVHVVLFSTLLFAPAPPDATDSEVAIELVSRAEAAEDVEATRVIDAPEAPMPLPPEDLLEPPLEGDPRREGEGVRELLHRREEAFARDMATRAQRVAALERFLAARAAAPPGAEVHACGANDAGAPLAVTASRSMARYRDVVPMGLFPPRYLDEVQQVRRASGAPLGRVEMALPAREVVISLDAPAGAVVAVGRRDARCLVGFSWSKDVFPLVFRGLPARYVDARDEVHEALIDVSLYEDASFEVAVRAGGPLPFARGSLYDQATVSRNLQQHALGARVVRDFLGALFGG